MGYEGLTIALLASIMLSASLFSLAPAQTIEQASWISLPSNMPPLNYPSCFALQGDVYCVGGGANYTPSASINANGTIGQWYALPQYPENETNQECAYSVNNSYIACVGGIAHNPPKNTSSGSNSSANASITGLPPALGPQQSVYISKAYASGTIGGWGVGGVYPFTPFLNSCAAGGVYIYCIGGFNLTTYNAPNGTRIVNLYSVSNTIYKRNLTNSVYYAQMGVPGGLSALNSTSAYPKAVAAESCVASGSYVYCIGGLTPGGNTNSVYYSKIQPDGSLGKWLATANYPFSINSQSCVFLRGSVLCVGGLIGASNSTTAGFYYAGVQPSGALGPWTRLADYPLYISGESCTPYNSTVYCFGGFSRQQGFVTNASYSFNVIYAPVSNTTATTTILPNATTTAQQNVTATTTPVTPTTIPTVTVGPGAGQTTTISQPPVKGSSSYLLLILLALAIAAIAAYLYLTRKKKGPQVRQPASAK